MKRCSKSLAIMSTQIKTTMRYHYTNVKTAKISIVTMPNTGEDVEIWDHFCTADGNTKWNCHDLCRCLSSKLSSAIPLIRKMNHQKSKSVPTCPKNWRKPDQANACFYPFNSKISHLDFIKKLNMFQEFHAYKCL